MVSQLKKDYECMYINAGCTHTTVYKIVTSCMVSQSKKNYECMYINAGCTYTTIYKIVTSWYLSQRKIMNACVLKQAVDILLSTRLSRHGISVKERL